MRALALSALTLPALVLAGCSAGTTDDAGSEVVVLAAASLTESFTELERLFEDEHPAVDVRLSFASSATLAQQVLEGAPADVLATADPRTMSLAANGGVLDGAPHAFATNALVLVTPPDDPGDVVEIADLDRASYVVCVASAPCGALAAELLAANGVTAPPVSFEIDVKAVLAKVVLDEVDAGLVYATDARAAGTDVAIRDVSGGDELVTSYPIAQLANAAAPDLASAWIDLVRSPMGRAVLVQHGFGTP